jgi:hypothetical protein
MCIFRTILIGSASSAGIERGGQVLTQRNGPR